MVIKNRFEELKQIARDNGQNLNIEPVNNAHVNTTALSTEEDEEFLEKIEQRKKQVDTLASKIDDLKIKHNALINPTIDSDENALRKELDHANDDIQLLATQTNTGLKKMKLELDKVKNEINEKSKNQSNNTSADQAMNNNHSKALLRMQQNHYNVLTRRFKGVMEDYSKEQLGYKEKLKSKLKKQMRVVDQNHEFDEEQLDEMIEKGNMQVFDEGFIKIQQNKQILDELEMRKNEMLNLEKAITELHALFVEMANLVDEQGEMVNRILDNVTNTEAYVEKAVEDVHQAARYQSGARRKKLWVVILCMIIMAVVALIIYLSIPKA